VTAFVPHYAMSGGSLIALAADEIVMDPNAGLGPVDPQIGDWPAGSIVKLAELKNPAVISDEMLILVDSRPRRGRPDGPLPAGRKRPAVGAPGFGGRVGRSYRWRMLFRSRD
jgi:hypothetical protein